MECILPLTRLSVIVPSRSLSCAGFVVLVLAFRRGVKARSASGSSAGAHSLRTPSGDPSGGPAAPGPHVGATTLGRQDPDSASPPGHADAASAPLLRLGLPLRLPFGLPWGGDRGGAARGAAGPERREGAPAGSPSGGPGAAYPQQPIAPAGAGGGVLWRRGVAETLEGPGASQPGPGSPAGGPVLWRRDDAPAPAGGILWTRSEGPPPEDALRRDDAAAPAGDTLWERSEGSFEGAASSPAAGNGGASSHMERPLNGTPAPLRAGAVINGVGAAGGADVANGWEDPWRAPYPKPGASAPAGGHLGAGAGQRGMDADSSAVALGNASAMEDPWRNPMGQGPLQSAEPPGAGAGHSAGNGTAVGPAGRDVGSGLGVNSAVAVQRPEPAERRAGTGAPARGAASRDKAAAGHRRDRAALLDNFEA